MKNIFTIIMLTLVLSFSVTAKEQPNIVFFFVDDLGWKDLGSYGGQFIETPNIDKLASQSMRFTNAYASPTCTPTRATVLSGQTPARHGLWEVGGVIDRPYAKMKSPKKSKQLNKGMKTFAHALNQQGYVSGLVGKWHVGGSPDEYGFVKIDQKISDPKLQQYTDENQCQEGGVTTAKSIEFIRKNKDKPFFLSVNHHLVHAPLCGREDLIKKYQNKLRKTGITDIHPSYAAMTEVVDESMNMLVKELKELGLLDNTIIMLYSDNGGLVSDMYLREATPLATTMKPLRSQKGSLYEAGIRVPFMVKWPGKVKPGTTTNEVIIASDLYSTIIEMAGAKLPKNQMVDGVSLVDLLIGKKDSLERDAVYWHFPTSQWTRSPVGAIRKGNYKLIEHFNDGSIELFNLEDDIGETVNLVNRRPAKAQELFTDLKAWRATVDAPMPSSNSNYDPIREKELAYHKWLESKK